MVGILTWRMRAALRLFALVLGLPNLLNCKSNEGDQAASPWNTYRAAVVEYSPFSSLEVRSSSEASQVMLRNAQKYYDLAIQAGQSGAQIVVFPEYGLFGPVLRSRDDTRFYAEVLPRTGSCVALGSEGVSPTLSTLLRAANTSGSVIVFHMAESAGPKLYSAQVALSPEGCVLAKYHKYHLYGEALLFDQPLQPEVVTFDTNFGIRFAMFICFDIMFGAPESVARARGISDFVFSSWWVNFPPLLLATQVQSAWAASMRANLLAANTGANGWRSSGSGIYSFAPPEGDLRRSQRNLYHNSTLLEGEGTMVVDVVHSPKGGSAASPSTVVSGSESSHDMCADHPMAFALTPLRIGVQQTVQASANGTHCRAALLPTASTGSMNWYLLAASGMYHGLFELEVCAIVPCDRSDLSCIDSLGARQPALLVGGNVSVSAFFASQNTTLAFATRPTGFPIGESQVSRPNATTIIVTHDSSNTLSSNEEGVYTLAVANRVYRAQTACSHLQTHVREVSSSLLV